MAKTAAGTIKLRLDLADLVADLHGLASAIEATQDGTVREMPTTALTVIDSPKMLRETLCVAQSMINGWCDDLRSAEHVARLGRLIDACDELRPLGSDGKHGDLHTPECGCDDKPPRQPASRCRCTAVPIKPPFDAQSATCPDPKHRAPCVDGSVCGAGEHCPPQTSAPNESDDLDRPIWEHPTYLFPLAVNASSRTTRVDLTGGARPITQCRCGLIAIHPTVMFPDWNCPNCEIDNRPKGMRE